MTYHINLCTHNEEYKYEICTFDKALEANINILKEGNILWFLIYNSFRNNYVNERHNQLISCTLALGSPI